MTFLLSKLLWDLLRPSLLPLFLALAGLALSWAGRAQAGRWLLTVGLGAYLLILLLPVDQWALLPLEDRFARPAVPPARVDGIVVLSGGLDAQISRDRGIPSLNAAAERMTEAVALARRYPQARVVFTGASSALIADGPTEAEWAGRLFAALGLPASRLTIEGSARNTRQNAQYSFRLVHPAAGECWLLITSARHMPRAVGVFRRIGWNVTPWPVSYKASRSLRAWMALSLGERLVKLDTAVHEWIGLLAYRLMGWTRTLFPARTPRSAGAGPCRQRPGSDTSMR